MRNKELYDLYSSEKNEMDGACSTYIVEEVCIQGFVGKLERKRLLADLGVDGIILKWMFKK